MFATAVPTARRRPALAVLIALLTALLAGPAAALAALPAAAAPNVSTFTVSPANPSQTDAVTMTVTINGCAGQLPWNVYYIADSQPYRQSARKNARYTNGVLTNGGDTWTASVTLPAGSFELGPFTSYAYGIGPTCFSNGGQFLNSNTVLFSVKTGTTVSGVAPATAVAGDTVPVDVAVNPTSASGSVTITENGTTRGSGTLSAGTARVDAGPLTAGPHDLVVTYGGNPSHAGSTSAPMHIEVARATSPLTVVATPSPSVRFQDVTVDVTAPASADGTFDISEGGLVLSSGNALVDGVGSTVLSDLATGPHDLLVSYSGSTEHLPSTAPVSVGVSRAPSPLSVTATPAGLVRFESLRLDVTAPSTADGTFDVSEGGTVLSSGNALVDGVGSTVLDDLTARTHDLLVSYSGSADHEPSTAPFSVGVARAPTSLSVTATPNDAVRFESVRLDVTAPATADGTFEVTDGAVSLSSGNAIVDGVGSVVLDDLASGPHHLIVWYFGSADHEQATAPVSVDIARASSPLSVTATPTDADRFEPVWLDVATLATADGTFDVSEDGVVLTSGSALVDGTGSVELTDLASGPHDLLVTYSGSADHEPSTALVHVDVARVAAPLTVTATPSSVLRWDWFDLLVEGPAGSSGTFTISENGVVLSEDNVLSDGSGQAGFGDLPAGVHELLVSYSGSADYLPSTATTTVTVDLRPTTTSLIADRDGSQLTLTAEVLPDADWDISPHGWVQFTDGDVVLGTVELSSGLAELVVLSAAVGPHELQARYVGDDTSGPSDSIVVTAVVPGMTVPTTATAGEPLRVQATGFAPGSDVDVLLDGELLATLVADADGAVDGDVIVPITASGSLELTVRGEGADGGVVLLLQDIVVAAAPPPPAAPVRTPAASHVVTFLARTGPTEPLALALAGLLSLLVGATFVAQSRAGRPSGAPRT